MATRLIDGHTHVFNVGFLPVEGIMRARGVPKILAGPIAKFLERVLERDLIEHTSDKAEGDEADRLRLMEMLESELHAGAAEVRVAEERLPDRPDLITRVVVAVPDDVLEDLRDDLEPLADLLGASPASRAISDSRSSRLVDGQPHERERRLLDQLLREAARATSGAVSTESESAELSVESASARGVIEWLLLLLVHEQRITRAFPDAWDPAVSFQAHVHHHMDMELHYPGRPPVYRAVGEQLERIRALAANAQIALLPFVAYGAFREDAVQIVSHALQNGFAGVKFYPPNGYRPIDNADEDLDQKLLHKKGIKLTGGEMDERNLELFRDCVRLDAPIFTHCTSGGMEARRKLSGRFSNPRHWRRVLETDESLKSLRLCLGHAGGQEGWMAPLDAAGNSAWAESYAYEVLELCAEFNNVYCDFGYFGQLLESGDSAHRFRVRLEAAVKRYPQFAEKCCYGTDWHLMSIEKHASEYPHRFERLLLESEVLMPHADKILRTNALGFLNVEGYLERAGGTLGEEERQRLEGLLHRST
jgi:predicted TIM-barrel fold metal-dependent hydrolase